MRALLAALCAATLVTGCSLKETSFTPDDRLPAPTMATITVSRAGAAIGSVSAEAIQLSCTDACTASVPIGTTVTLLATPETGAVFGGWSGDCAGAEPSCTVAATKDLVITAQFDVAMFNVEVAMTGSGAGSVMSTSGELLCPDTCTASVPYNTALELIAAPASESTFLGWTGACGGTDACVVTVTGPIMVAAAFAADNELIVTPAGHGTGVVTSSPAGISCGTACSARFPPGTAVTLSATPADDSLFAGWSVAGCEDTITCTVTMSQAALVTANFALKPRQLTVARHGNGTVTSDPAGISCGDACTASYDAHTVVTLTATPSADSTFTSWTGCADNAATKCTVTMDQASSVTATFTLKQFVLSVGLAGTGTGTVGSSPGGIACPGDCSEPYNINTIVTLTASPAAGSMFVGWSGACAGMGSCQVTMTAALSVTAAFAQQMLVAINDTTQHLERIDPTTFAVTDIGPLGVPYAFGDCMFNPADQTLYMVDGRGNFGLYRVNLTTGAASLVGLHGVSAMEAIAYHPPTNKVYSISIDAPTNFYSLSTTTGAATTIGPVAGRFQAMAWDSTRNMMVAFDGVTLFSVDVTTGGMTAIANPTAVANYGMTYDPSIDRFWVVDFNNQILQLDPNAGFATTRSGTLGGPHTCIAVAPQP